MTQMYHLSFSYSRTWPLFLPPWQMPSISVFSFFDSFANRTHKKERMIRYFFNNNSKDCLESSINKKQYFIVSNTTYFSEYEELPDEYFKRMHFENCLYFFLPKTQKTAKH
mmetsp:Transcript_28228/g.40916  ORF Transcript_28228/g.40916 Transcript_28228/m.40916 type:complete len:111 (+) Transcript_28228:219-551(+)